MAGRLISPRLLGLAAGLVALAGVAAIVGDADSELGCDILRTRLESMGVHAGPTQRWEDIYALQEHVDEGVRLQHMIDDAACTL
jgi:hypothetical protein